MSSMKATQRADAKYVVALGMTVAGSSMAVLSALNLVSAYFQVRSLMEEFDATASTQEKAFEMAWAAVEPFLIVGLVVGISGFVALRLVRRRASADRSTRQFLMGLGVGLLLFFALSLLTLLLHPDRV